MYEHSLFYEILVICTDAGDYWLIIISNGIRIKRGR
jgi:hypothetical protein